MNRCGNCGQENDDNASFCKKCGAGFAAPKGAQVHTPPVSAGAPGPPGPPPGPGGASPPPGIEVRPGPSGFPPTEFRLEGEPQFAGFWIRFLAILIDGLVVAFALSPFRWVARNTGSWFMWTVFCVIYVVVYVTYFIIMTGRFGQTLGKMALSLKVVKQDFTPVDYGVSAVRELSKILSAIIFYIGFIMAGFTDRKRALHDMIADTYVLRI